MQIFRNKKVPYIELKIGTEKDYSVRQHSHTEMSIGIIEKGSYNVSVKDLDFSLKINDIILIPPDSVHLCIPDLSSKFSFKMLYINSDWLHEVFKIDSNNFTPGVRSLSSKEKEKIDTYLQVFQNIDDQLKLETDCIFLLEFLLNNIFSVHSNKNIVKTHSNTLMKIKKYLDENFYYSISLDELSDISGLNKFYLLRIFKNKFKLTPHAYIINLRFNKAKKLLNSKMQVSEISAECGFFDQSHFVKTFKQYFGMNPQEYRK